MEISIDIRFQGSSYESDWSSINVSGWKFSVDMRGASDISQVDSESDGSGESVTKSINLLMNGCQAFFFIIFSFWWKTLILK